MGRPEVVDMGEAVVGVGEAVVGVGEAVVDVGEAGLGKVVGEELVQAMALEGDSIVVGWIIFQDRRDPLQCLTVVFNSLMNFYPYKILDHSCLLVI